MREGQRYPFGKAAAAAHGKLGDLRSDVMPFPDDVIRTTVSQLSIAAHYPALPHGVSRALAALQSHFAPHYLRRLLRPEQTRRSTTMLLLAFESDSLARRIVSCLSSHVLNC